MAAARVIWTADGHDRARERQVGEILWQIAERMRAVPGPVRAPTSLFHSGADPARSTMSTEPHASPRRSAHRPRCPVRYGRGTAADAMSTHTQPPRVVEAEGCGERDVRTRRAAVHNITSGDPIVPGSAEVMYRPVHVIADLLELAWPGLRYRGCAVVAAETRKRVLEMRRGYRNSWWWVAETGENPLMRRTRLRSTGAPPRGETSLPRMCEVAVKLGDRVRIRPAGVSVFKIVDADEEGRFVLESVDGIPEGYRFPMREEDLIPE